LLDGLGNSEQHYEALAVTRARTANQTAGGLLIYVSDVDSRPCWSAGLLPTRTPTQDYAVRFDADAVEIRRQDREIELITTIRVDPNLDGELRSCVLTNHGQQARTLEVTSYLEWVLQQADADHSHPAFSKLFVQTAWHPEYRAIVASRRPRASDQPILHGAHWIDHLQGPAEAAEISYETSRSHFVGRGRSLSSPAALDPAARLTKTLGPVLDPIASLRARFTLAAGESAAITFATSARPQRTDLLDRVAESLATRRSRANDQAVRVAHAGTNGAAPLDTAAPSPPAYQPPPSAPPLPAGGESLQFFNGLGGFSAEGHEYVIHLRPDAEGRLTLPPLPWSHVVANEQAGFIATEVGAGYTWTINSRENRLTHWHNDPVCDPHSEAHYLRDERARTFWSPLPGPATSVADHEVRYGFGYALYRQHGAGFTQQTTQFVPPSDPVKITRVELENLQDQPRELTAFAYAHLALSGGLPPAGLATWYDGSLGAVFASNSQRELSARVAFACLVTSGDPADVVFTCDREEFLGTHGELSAPDAVVRQPLLQCRIGEGSDRCLALQGPVRVEPRGRQSYWVLLGEAADEATARQLIERYRDPERVAAAYDGAKCRWSELLGRFQIQTPSVPLNLMINGWLPYQNLCCRMLARSAYYQSGGAYGFRDQLQDSSAFLWHAPELTRTQILRNAQRQFPQGDVLHWWHPPGGGGLRTRFADDLLWMPLIACEYVLATGDDAIWEETTPYLSGAQLEEGEQERFMVPRVSSEQGTLYEHCCRAIDRSLAVGAHGLPLMGCGDWNDGMNRIGQGGRGESVWMGFFLSVILEKFADVCRSHGDLPRADRYLQHRQGLVEALNGPGWDGAWYRRAFFDDGTPVGSAESAECQLDALAQAWAVLSRVAPEDRAASSVEAVLQRLVSRKERMIKLLDPPFNQLPLDPGYIQGYLPGVRENGGQYTHGILWFVRALGQLGRGTLATQLLEMLTPVMHSDTPEHVAQYQAEPYVVAADVYGQPPHVGRAGWTWYTGSAGWMFRVAVETLLGMRREGGTTLVIDPVLSSSWPSCRIVWRLPSSTASLAKPVGEASTAKQIAATWYEITIANSSGRESGVQGVTIDGRAGEVRDGAARVELVDDGARHTVLVSL
jgi:cyclic beta-1,2-glucan synthetase